VTADEPAAKTAPHAAFLAGVLGDEKHRLINDARFP
jgi:hypothetical protein